ncbi:MAG: Gfo/Idh/MocA family oxidoreductase [Burkholderiales bacterium]|nr:Gfo/Idh/MocA family oxidoreductase [Burkholderiales bacterium]MDE1926040.1 Gfo/Idh/MocA family oxidoreductase [Burkholderiales bacterium]MDE2158950.1 Gfo/Idh/MocA family oxidoreductase [Burkholderiales bacterium]MDE2504025.1 Gfo/Idh/MocA family oxidoreductase [Burkholderiales bacterium]
MEPIERSTTSFGWALLGPGSIARKFAQAVQGVEGAHVEAVWGRNPARSASFVHDLGLSPALACTDLAALLGKASVQGVYIATTHPAHADLVRQALAAGKPVVCEKPMTTSHRDTADLVELSRARGVFLMEALWTRFLPVYQGIARWLGAGRIGRLRSVSSSFCFPAPYDPHSRLFDPLAAGGTLLDIGIYNVALTRWAIATAHGQMPALTRRQVSSALAPTGVDLQVSALLDYADGTTAQFVCAFDRLADNGLSLHGSQGCIEVPTNFWEAECAVLKRPGEADEWLRLPHAVNGFEYQIIEAMRCIAAGAVESPLMPHRESLEIARELDQLLASAGVQPAPRPRPAAAAAGVER